LAARVPASQPQLLAGEAVPTLAILGDLPTSAEMGLGFEASAAAQIAEAGLGIVPRPVSFAWPEARLVERTLEQAAALPGARPGPRIVAFEGDLILGHEMHLDSTVAALVRFGLSFAYFSETRHQKGDWFIAKRLAPAGQVILSHYFTPAAMVPEDFHSAAHHWGMLARARSIRLCYVNVFRRIHATDPLECLHYIEHIREELEGLGLTFGAGTTPVLDAPDRQTQALAALAPAGAASLAASQVLGLGDVPALGLTLLAAAGAAALPYLDRPRGRLEHDYPPSYAPKLLALAGAAAAPAAAALSGNLAAAAVIQAGTGASLAALTTGQDYQQRIETFRSLNLDWALPLAAVLMRRTRGRTRWLGLGALGAAWVLVRTRTPDLLSDLDLDLPAGHTHHLSAAQRMMGDTVIALGPRPGRKWAGLGMLGLAAAGLLERLGQQDAADAAAVVATLANSLMLAAFRQPARPLAQTLEGLRKSWQRMAPVAVGLAGAGNFMVEGPADDDS
jgi:hypothetical protein